MIIQSLEIEHFGKFRNLSLKMNAGINVLAGSNETGKTTIAYFVKAMIFGMSPESGEQKRFLPYENDGIYGGSLEVRSEDQAYRITRSFLPGNETLVIVNTRTGETISDPEALLTLLRGGITLKEYEVSGFFSENARDRELFAKSDEKDAIREKQMSSRYDAYAGIKAQELTNQYDREKASVEELQKKLKHCRDSIQEAQIMSNALQPGLKVVSEKEKEASEKRDALLSSKQELEEIMSDSSKKKGSRNILGTLFFVLGILTALVVWFLYTANGGEQTIITMAGTGAGGLFGILGILFTIISMARAGKNRKNAKKEARIRKDLEEAEKAVSELEGEYGKPSGSRRDYDEMQDRIRSLGEEAETLATELREATQRMNSAKAELDAMGSEEELRAGEAVPRIRALNDAATQWLKKFGFKDRQVEFFGDEAMVYFDGGQMIPAEEMSQAARQSVYLAARLAKLYGRGQAGTLPLILDDVFANYDGDRVRIAIQALRDVPGQILLLSCQKREQAEL